jgi:hypothetical protein
MKSVAVIALAVVAIAVALPRNKRQAFFLPDGVELIVGPINTNFNCDGLRYGYYADIDNNCQIFHVCNPITHADGNQETLQYSFFCGNQTVFNQLTLTCAFPEDAVPCQNARDFYYVNDNIGIEDAVFLKEEDIVRASQVGKK